MKIFYIAGHGAGDPGACGNGYQEAERVRALGNRLKQLGGDNVVLSDFNRDYYADNGISSLNIDKKQYAILEAHMDAAQVNAKGAHVIINGIYEPDQYDKALAENLTAILPGRSQKIVKRNDLANPKRAAAKDYNYRLVEFGFITNAGDVDIFNKRMDEVCNAILKSFGIKTASVPTKPSANGDSLIAELYRSGTSIKVKTKDGTIFTL